MGRGEKELKETWGKRECAGEIKSLCQSYKKLFLDCASLVAQRLKRLPGMQETRVQSLGRSKASFSLWNIRFQLKLDCASLTSLSDISFKGNPLSDGSGQLKASANV